MPVALVLLSLAGRTAAAAVVVIVRTSDAEPYAQADTAIHERLADRHDDLRSVLLKDVSQNGIDATIGKADAVVAIGTGAARWLHKALPPSIKLGYCMVSNAREAGLMDNRDAFGVTTDISIARQFSLISEALPHAQSVGMLYRSDSDQSKRAMQSLSADLPAGWHVEAVAVNDFPSIADSINALTRKSVDVIWTTADQKLYDTASVRALLLAALRAKIPVWGFSPAFVRAGALLGVGVEPSAQGTQVADILATVLTDPKAAAHQGAQEPNKFQIAVNLIVAEQLGVDIPDSLSRRATFVYRPEK